MEIKSAVDKQLKQIDRYIEQLEIALKLAVSKINKQREESNKVCANDYIESAKSVIRYKVSTVWYKSMHDKDI